MKKIFTILAVFCATISSFAKDYNSDAFKIEISNQKVAQFTYTVTPKDSACDYYSIVLSEKDYDAVENGDYAAYYDDVLGLMKWFLDYLIRDGIDSGKEWTYATFARKGVFSKEIVLDNLFENNVVIAAKVDLNTGTCYDATSLRVISLENQAAAIDEVTVSEVKVVKVVENGKVVIKRNGVTYNLNGSRVK